MGPRTHDVLWIFHDNGEPVPGDGHAKAFERIAMNAEIMDLGVPDLPKTYDFVISLAALFALSLNRPTGKHTNSFDAGDGVHCSNIGADL